MAACSWSRWLIADLAAIDGVLDDVLARARLAARFGADKLVGGEELTSVAWGLAARARAVFG